MAPPIKKGFIVKLLEDDINKALLSELLCIDELFEDDTREELLGKLLNVDELLRAITGVGLSDEPPQATKLNNVSSTKTLRMNRLQKK